MRLDFGGDVAKIPLGVYRRLSNGGKEVRTDHFLHRLLREPNDWQDGFEFKEMLQASLVLRGNGYAVAVRNQRGVPIYLVPIHPDRVGLFEAPSGEVFYAVTRSGLHEMAMLRPGLPGARESATAKGIMHLTHAPEKPCDSNAANLVRVS